MKEIDESLRRLHTGYIDIYQVHWLDPLLPIEETAAAMHELYKQGKIRALDQPLVTVALWEARHPDQLAPIADVGGWKLDLAALKAIDEILRTSVTDPVGPEFTAPPAQLEQNREKVMQRSA
jgi:aryl-alcohol dehydrogenase-like predicted oxidoreductase